jgi:hypothetical protein
VRSLAIFQVRGSWNLGPELCRSQCSHDAVVDGCLFPRTRRRLRSSWTANPVGGNFSVGAVTRDDAGQQHRCMVMRTLALSLSGGAEIDRLGPLRPSEDNPRRPGRILTACRTTMNTNVGATAASDARRHYRRSQT